MSIGTLTFHRFNGTEQFAISKAELFLLEGDGSPRLSFDFEADRTLKTLPDTESLHALPGGEFNVGVPSLDISNLVGQTAYHTSEIIEPFEEIRCTCGADVQPFESPGRCPFYDSRLPNRCPSCQTEMNCATIPMTVRDGFTGIESKASGGVTYRFALVVDCGKYWPESDAAVTPEFVAVVEQTLGIKSRVFRDFY